MVEHRSPTLRILLVEDNRADRIAFDLSLESSEIPHEICHYSDAEKALEHIFRNPGSFDLVVADHRLPGMTGLELCREIKQRFSLPTVILTGAGSETIAVEALKSGVDDYLIKDVSGMYSRILPTLLPEVVRRHRDRFLRFRAEKELNLTLAQKNAILDNAPFGIVYLREEKIVWINTGMETLSGYANTHVSGKRLDPFFSPIDTHADANQAFETLRREGTFRSEWRIETKNQNRMWCQVSAKVLTIEGKDEGSIWIFEDITERMEVGETLRLAKEKAEAATKAKSDFLAAMSHEIRTPLNGVVGLTELLGQTELTETQHKFLDLIQASSEMLLAVISDILDISKIEAGKMTLEILPFNLTDCVDNLIGMLAVKAVAKNLRITRWIDPEIPRAIQADKNKLRQVLFNLIGNSIKFAETGNIHVTVAKRAEETDGIGLTFSVEDSGIGIPEEKLDTLFEPFAQLDSSISRRYGGSGLGLTICQAIIKLMGGRIWCESVPGTGTTFFFEIAAGIADPLAFDETDEESVENDVGMQIHPPFRILFVEDCELNREVGVLMLKSLGYDADVAKNGREGVALAKQKNYDVVLMDIHMPEMDGIEATRRIRAHYPEECQPRIIAMTADALSERRDEYLGHDMDDFLPKPIRTKDLSGVLTACARIADEDEKQGPAENASEALTDLSEITAMAHGNDEVIARWINIFLADTPEIVDQMEKAVSKNDPASLAQRAHSLKSQSMLMGATRLSQLAKKLEFAATQKKTTEMADDIVELKTVFEKVRISLESELAKRRP